MGSTHVVCVPFFSVICRLLCFSMIICRTLPEGKFLPICFLVRRGNDNFVFVVAFEWVCFTAVHSLQCFLSLFSIHHQQQPQQQRNKRKQQRSSHCRSRRIPVVLGLTDLHRPLSAPSRWVVNFLFLSRRFVLKRNEQYLLSRCCGGLFCAQPASAVAPSSMS